MDEGSHCAVLRQSPLLAAWAALLARVAAACCHLLELDCQLRPPEEQCATAAWVLSLGVALLAAAFLLGSAATGLLRWLTQRDGSRMIVVAAEVLAELRKVQPLDYPSQRHLFASAPAGAVAADPLAPLLCAVCQTGISGGGAAPHAASLRCCMSCGLLTHDGCARRAGKSCRPLCCAAERQPHFWQAHGTVLEPEALEGGGGGGGAAGLSCLYCGEPAETDALAAEPLWRCSLCAAACHVQCFCDAHPQLKAVGAKLRALLDGGSSGGQDGRQQQQRQERQERGQGAGPRAGQAGGAGAGPVGSSSSSEDGDPRLPLAPPADGAAGAAGALGNGSLCRRRSGARPSGAAADSSPRGRPRQSRSGGWLQALAGVVGGGGASGGGSGAAAEGDSGYSSDSESDDPYDARVQRQRWQRRRRRRLHFQDIGRLDECTLGPSRRSVLPPTAVRPALRNGGSSRSQLDQLATAAEQEQATPLDDDASSTAGLSDISAAAATTPREPRASRQKQQATPQQPQRPGPAAADGSREGGGGGGGGGGGSGKKKRSSWWRRLYRPKHLQWQDYRIDQLPPGCKPVVVFINIKSGPQVGSTLRQRFLRTLHPLQVVELPRQKPDAALQLFAPVAVHTRVLVVGGDGSVAWILSTLEDIKAAQAAGGNPHWKPPPVAVLPLGTGNDLARCLGWGGGHGIWQQEGVSTMLAEVQHAAPLHIDRWNVSFLPPAPPEPSTPLSPRGKLQVALEASKLQSMAGMRLSSLLQRGGGGGGGGGGGAAGPRPVVKQMNNYLGIGVDAKVALEFHQMREQLPFLFGSQLGNKLWYTAVGGKDIVSGHACANLAQKLQVVCDGRPVELPPDIEGLLVLNISSYMGGVDLWRNGYSLAGPDRRGGSGCGGLAGGGGRHSAQSMMDGRVELVAVYGSWHLGQLQVGLSRAVRLGQGQHVAITSLTALPMQVDGEPWVQAPAAVAVDRRGQGLVLRRVQSKPLARMMQALAEVLEESEHRGTITPAQHHTLMADLSARLQPLLLHPS